MQSPAVRTSAKTGLYETTERCVPLYARGRSDIDQEKMGILSLNRKVS
jgi:hypothetical protein